MAFLDLGHTMLRFKYALGLAQSIAARRGRVFLVNPNLDRLDFDPGHFYDDYLNFSVTFRKLPGVLTNYHSLRRFFTNARRRVPQFVVVGQVADHHAVRECAKLNLPYLALFDSNTNAALAGFYNLPANDDSVITRRFILTTLFRALRSGLVLFAQRWLRYRNLKIRLQPSTRFLLPEAGTSLNRLRGLGWTNRFPRPVSTRSATLRRRPIRSSTRGFFLPSSFFFRTFFSSFPNNRWFRLWREARRFRSPVHARSRFLAPSKQSFMAKSVRLPVARFAKLLRRHSTLRLRKPASWFRRPFWQHRVLAAKYLALAHRPPFASAHSVRSGFSPKAKISSLGPGQTLVPARPRRNRRPQPLPRKPFPTPPPIILRPYQAPPKVPKFPSKTPSLPKPKFPIVSFRSKPKS